MAVQSDGKILLAGYVNTSKIIAVARYNAAGSVDTDFGTNGLARITVTDSTSGEACAAALQKNGKILVAATAIMSTYTSIILARLNADGSLDTTFARSAIDGNDNGIAVFNTGTDTYAKSFVIQDDGRVVLTGHQQVGSNNDVMVVRFK